MLGAIVIAGNVETETKLSSISSARFSTWESWHPCPASVPMLGCSTVARTVDHLRRTGIDEISVFGGRSQGKIPVGVDVEGQAWQSADRQLRIYREDGLETVLIVRVGAYVETDLAALVSQHRHEGQSVTRAADREGVLDLWAVDMQSFDAGDDLFSALAETAAAECEVDGYVNRLYTPHDFRRLASDLLTGKCKARPRGSEIRPGIWMEEGVQVARGARVVAPAYIGRDVRIADDCLITRCSNVESWSQVDFGTAIEDTSVLTNTYIGIGLDLSQSIVDGDQLLNLRHEVRLHISDPVVMKRNVSRAHQRERLVQAEASELTL